MKKEKKRTMILPSPTITYIFKLCFVNNVHLVIIEIYQLIIKSDKMYIELTSRGCRLKRGLKLIMS